MSRQVHRHIAAKLGAGSMNLLFIINSILLGVGLAMDAFSVSLANGLAEKKLRFRKIMAIAGTFASFQIAMPIIGWFCVNRIASAFAAFQHFIPWIALILLLLIGGKMVIEGIKKEAETEKETVGALALFIQGIATSIDALSVGFTIADYSFKVAFIESLIIGFVTLMVCISGVLIGHKVGTKLADKATILGGVILIGIGIEIFVTGMFG